MRTTEQLPLHRLNNIVFLVLLSLSISAFAQNIGFLSVSVDPGVEIFLDSSLVGNQSFNNLALNAGTYE